jgi:hypothetical protein
MPRLIMPTPASRGRHRMADRPARRIPPARQVWSVWVVNPLVLSFAHAEGWDLG